MSTQARSGRVLAPLLPMVVAQTRALVTTWLRVPAFTAPSLALPLVFYTFFGLPNAGKHFADGLSVGVYLLCSFGAYGVSSVMVFSFGIGVATQRGQKIDLLQRAMPLPGGVVIASNVITAALYAVASFIILTAFAVVVGGIRVAPGTLLEIVALLLAGSLPLIGMGMAIGYWASPNAAPAVANLIYLPMAFASGMFVPIADLPDFVRVVARYLPTYHFAQLAYTPIHKADEALGTALIWTAVWAAVLLALAVRAYSREQERKFS